MPIIRYCLRFVEDFGLQENDYFCHLSFNIFGNVPTKKLQKMDQPRKEPKN